MRLFKPILASAVLTPIEHFILSSALLHRVSVSNDLSELYVQCRRTISKRHAYEIQAAIDAELKQFPFQTSCQFRNGTFCVSGLVDIRLALEDVVETLKKKEPTFFSELENYVKMIETDELPSTPGSDFFGGSLERFQYFSLNAFRQNGMQHAIEFPLKALQKNAFISQKELNAIILDVWKKTNVMRQQKWEQKQKEVPMSLPENEFVPYVFSKR